MQWNTRTTGDHALLIQDCIPPSVLDLGFVQGYTPESGKLDLETVHNYTIVIYNTTTIYNTESTLDSVFNSR